MNAAQARSATSKGLSDIAKRKAADNEKERAARRRADMIAMEGLPKFVRKVRDEIKKATAQGARSVRVEYGNTAVARKVQDALREDGYSVTTDHYAGYENYGDFNAPCNVWETRDWLVISW